MRGIARWEIMLDGEADRLEAAVGVTDDSEEAGPVWFEVVGDGRMLAETIELRRGDTAARLDVSLRGIEHLILTVQAPDSFTPSAAWADARIQFSGTEPVSIRRTVEEPYILTPPTPAAPSVREVARRSRSSGLMVPPVNRRSSRSPRRTRRGGVDAECEL